MMTEHDDDDAPRPIRDQAGRFLPGHKCITPGRPKKETEAAYHRATMTACTPEQWFEIIAAAVQDCSSPKVAERSAARNFLLKAIFGERPGALVQVANFYGDDQPGAPRLGVSPEGIAALRAAIMGEMGLSDDAGKGPPGE